MKEFAHPSKTEVLDLFRHSCGGFIGEVTLATPRQQRRIEAKAARKAAKRKGGDV